MSIFDFFRRLRPSPAQPPEAEAPPAEEPSGTAEAEPAHGPRLTTRYTVHVMAEPNERRAYEHAHVDGAFDGDPEAFEDYIAHRMQVTDLEAQIREAEEREAALQEREEKLQEAQEQLSDAREQVALHEWQEREAAEQVRQAQEDLQKAENEERETRGKGSLLHAAIYFSAGIAFFLGDLVVSQEVVSQALRIGIGDEPQIEKMRLLFALAIASLTFLLKPVYERLCERAYWEAREGNSKSSESIFRWVILLTAAVALVTLGLLGGLRAEYVQETAGAATTQQGPISLLDMSASEPAADEEDTGPSWLQIWAFILTAILFAVAGAISLGIASLQWERYRTIRGPAWFRLRKLSKAKKKDGRRGSILEHLREAHRSEAAALAQQRSRLANLEARAAQLGPHEALQAEREALRKHLRELQGAHAEAEREALTASYRSGYRLAQARYEDAPPSAFTSGNGEAAHEGDEASEDFDFGLWDSPPSENAPEEQRRRTHRRPFLWVRDDIMEDARRADEPAR